jgi:2,4-dienoyl-CoA reductase (NADPH2)
MQTAYKRRLDFMLFEPYKILDLTLANRIVMSAMNLGWAQDGQINQRIIDFYVERARGEAGLIMVGGATVESPITHGGFISIHDDSLLGGHKLLTNAVKEAGACIGLQLFHAGRYSFGFLDGRDVVAPSPIPSKLTRHTPKELSIAEIEDIVSNFAAAAGRAQSSGYQLVEVIMSAGYLVSQFLSPLTNQRSDEYGGSFQNRMRFPLEVITAIRQQVGPDFPIGVRLGGSDFMEGGNGWQEMGVVAKELEKASVNILNVTGGWHEAPIPQIQSEVPEGTYAYLAAKIKEQVRIPVVASNRINNPALAENILQNGQADLITVARGLLADPEWALKARLGKPIRKCIACMTCLDRLFAGQDLQCAVNPQCGKEDQPIRKSPQTKKFLIVGSGPAGLEAARIAALKGHQVTIWEKAARIGGQLNIALVPPGKQEFKSLLDFYEQELASLGVEIVLNKTAHSDTVKSGQYDIVLIATGALPRSLPFCAQEGAHVINAWDVLNGSAVKGPNIVVVGGGSVGCETALFLAEKGTLDPESLKFMMLNRVENPDTLYKLLTQGSLRIKLVEMGDSLAADMGPSTRWGTLKHMQTLGVEALTGVRVSSIAHNHVKVVRDDEEHQLKADTVVLAIGSTSNDRLHYELKHQMGEVYLLGDATSPAKLINATQQAFDLVNGL